MVKRDQNINCCSVQQQTKLGLRLNPDLGVQKIKDHFNHLKPLNISQDSFLCMRYTRSKKRASDFSQQSFF